ncbi:hypothetical protein VNI00_014946 [Paramarasmius palmivorus]|uniref:Uncharacterized protein n=1 Tax=Paramarasmius palmivorus TaxID=297713 RepID=A0AAW0BP12_9AGAR
MDSQVTPMKHLTVLESKFKNHTSPVSGEKVMECLLDEELTKKDPFQAAMGLVSFPNILPMASRAARQFFSSLRSSARPAFRAQHAGRRGMSSTAHEVKKGSDMPWIIGSAVVFGPAFLYLVSPGSRKTAPHKPHGKHDHHESQSHAPLPMKDDEGTEADVSGSVAKAVAEDAPKSDAAPTEAKEDKPEEKTDEKSEEQKEEPKKTTDEKKPAESPEPAGAKSDPGPTDMGEARSASVGKESPKGLDEKVKEPSS